MLKDYPESDDFNLAKLIQFVHKLWDIRYQSHAKFGNNKIWGVIDKHYFLVPP